LKAFTDALKTPVVTHARWFLKNCNPPTPLENFGISGGLLRSYNGWRQMLGPVHDAGSRMFEQDWLDNSAQVATNVNEFDTVFNNMAQATRDLGMSMQYCMAQPKHYLQGAKYSNLGTMRTSDDGFANTAWGAERQRAHFFNTRIIWSLGIYPWTDNFPGSRIDLAIANAVSGGITGASDKIDSLPKYSNTILALTRRDGILVKPDIPALITDATIIGYARKRSTSMVARTFTDHGNGYKTFYVYVTPGPYSFQPSADGMNTANGFYSYNWATKKGTVMKPTDALTGTVPAGTGSYSYFMLAPISQSGIAFLGDKSKIIACGKQRISSLYFEGNQVVATVDIEPEENSPITLMGYSANTLTAAVSANGTITPVTYNAAAKTYSLTVAPANQQRTALEKVTVALGQNPSVSTKEVKRPFSPLSPAIAVKNGTISVTMEGASDYVVQIMGLSGRVYASYTCVGRPNLDIPIKTLKSGTYLVHIQSPSLSMARRIAIY
jgi:hypothetical protein